ncbi:hypothetical protein CFB47_24015 [Burkholderia sp. AU27893]|uniref:Uncharacterized protein n=1 Tax=Burkholderia contaminans TaxID=488447 RepID=A0A2S5E7G0_9BURK|nr:hypothetical protein CFB47_24015 [Burkholderia sp. AU27893]POZ87321.1 hypothetical protein C3743_13070 [Burkholderia contaminans]
MLHRAHFLIGHRFHAIALSIQKAIAGPKKYEIITGATHQGLGHLPSSWQPVAMWLGLTD